ncbi:MAG TPA: hypothetical protein VFR61_01855 [Nitrososphaeraceae archaeon]|nr:hypothetical protein [Nitrososphaeraceae archaeon]
MLQIKLEYAPKVIEIGSPEFFRVTLYHADKDEIALHADTDIKFLEMVWNFTKHQMSSHSYLYILQME